MYLVKILLDEVVNKLVHYLILTCKNVSQKVIRQSIICNAMEVLVNKSAKFD